MIIESKAPTRIDLSGSTLDIWPLYLYHDNAVTVNAAISVYARAKIVTRKDKAIILESKDKNCIVRVNSIDALKKVTKLELVSRLINFFKPDKGFHIITSSDAPPGSGLGGSSTLGIAISGALNVFTGSRFNKKEIIRITKDIETQVIKVPAGDQDYYPATYGGINALWLNVGGLKNERLDADIKTLGEHLILCYTGDTRFSGTNNWEITKGHIDQNKVITDNFKKIAKTSLAMRKAIVACDFKKIGKILDIEWKNRKQLSPGVSNRKIDILIDSAIKKGAVSAKVCGAGGGGCIVLYAKKSYRELIISELEQKGGEVIGFDIVKSGLKVCKGR